MNRKVRIAPSVLSADFTRLREELRSMEDSGADLIHVDVMDGHYVPNLSMGPLILPAIQKSCNLPMDVHLMITNPEKHIQRFADAGAAIMTVHYEVTGQRTGEVIERIQRMGVKAGISINPNTNIRPLLPYLDNVDLVLVMSVFPGFGGQAFMPCALDTIKKLASRIDPDRTALEVDGGIDNTTASKVIAAGADMLVSGSYLFAQSDRQAAMDGLRTGDTNSL